MKEKIKITDKQLVFLEDYIIRKKKFIDPEDMYELMDHLIHDFEATTTNGNLSQYLANKSWFISQYGIDKGSKTHWAYQRLLWKKFFSFFIQLKFIPITILIGSLLLYLSFFLDEKLLLVTFFLSIVGQIVYGLKLTYHEKKRIRKLISFKYLGNIMGLPQVFLYSLTLTKPFLINNRLMFFIYWILALGLSITGILVIKEKRVSILKKYKHLLS
uniref:hypothetical protein n=1 Tax=uncultured Tenacibaculum sp. TaxID=174713 RepID=UPI002628A879|nr:hypothetical protein [uncultured Tenacibaculum sp.]